MDDPDDALRRRVKIELRKRLRGVRQALPESACAERSGRIVERLLALPAVAGARAVALFWPMVERHEVDLRPLDRALRDRGVLVAYPTVDPETQAMCFRVLAAQEDGAPGALGFFEPPSSAPALEPGAIDAIVVPALVVDPSGQRIGYGAGFYDRTLPAFAPPAVSVAVAFDFQLLAEIPVTSGDVRVDWVVTDARTMDTRAETS